MCDAEMTPATLRVLRRTGPTRFGEVGVDLYVFGAFPINFRIWF